MMLSKKIKTAIENNKEIQKLFYPDKTVENWSNFTRTHFNNIAFVVNKKITRAVINNPDLVAHYYVIGN